MTRIVAAEIEGRDRSADGSAGKEGRKKVKHRKKLSHQRVAANAASKTKAAKAAAREQVVGQQAAVKAEAESDGDAKSATGRAAEIAAKAREAGSDAARRWRASRRRTKMRQAGRLHGGQQRRCCGQERCSHLALSKIPRKTYMYPDEMMAKRDFKGSETTNHHRAE